MTPQRLGKLVRRWRGAYFARDFGYALAAGCAAAAVMLWAGPGARTAWTALAALAGTLLVRSAASRWWTLDATRLARHLDRVHPELEESSRLWLRAPEDLTLLERLQRQRLDAAVAAGLSGGSAGPRFGQPPHRLLFAPMLCWTLSVGSIALVLVFGFHRRGLIKPSASLPAAFTRHAGPAPSPATAPAWPKVVGGGLTITPPPTPAIPSVR